MNPIRHAALAMALIVCVFGVVACDDDDADSSTGASQASIDELAARVQENEMVIAVVGIRALPLHDLDEAINGGEIPSNAISSYRTLLRLIAVTDWGETMRADAASLSEEASAAIEAIESDDMAAAGEQATAVHDVWHDMEGKFWDEFAPGTAAEDHAGGGAETPATSGEPDAEATP